MHLDIILDSKRFPDLTAVVRDILKPISSAVYNIFEFDTLPAEDKFPNTKIIDGVPIVVDLMSKKLFKGTAAMNFLLSYTDRPQSTIDEYLAMQRGLDPTAQAMAAAVDRFQPRNPNVAPQPPTQKSTASFSLSDSAGGIEASALPAM